MALRPASLVKQKQDEQDEDGDQDEDKAEADPVRAAPIVRLRGPII